MTSPLRELAAVFLRLGTTSFGGPAAHVAMMEDEVVTRRRWMSRAEFLDLLGVSQIIPGPNSTELAIHVGYARAGWAGLVVAGACFIVPAMLIVWAVAAAYVRYGALPEVGAVLAGIKPVVLAIIAHAIWTLGRTALVSAMTLCIGALAVLGLLMNVNEIAVLVLAGALAWLDWRLTRGGNLWERSTRAGGPAALGPSVLEPLALGDGARADAAWRGAPWIAAMFGGGGGAVAAFSMTKLFLVFAKAGALLFGSGYVLVAFLRADLVDGTRWLSESQLLDAVAVGQFTPGPLFTTATFVGYLLAGHAGALVATAGIFFPAFVFVAITAPIVARFRDAPAVRATLGGLNAASLALMLVAAVVMARDALQGPAVSVPLFALALFLLVRFRVNTAWLVLGGAVTGWSASALGLALGAGGV